MGRFSRLSYGIVVATAASLSLGLVACNEHPVTLSQPSGVVEVVISEDLGGGEKIDILWMIDNSGSMCRSQGILRESITEFVDILDEVNIDFHIGVTTSHMLRSCEYYQEEHNGEHPNTWWACNYEPIAVAGKLQSTPQPIPGPDRRCNHPVDPDTAEPIEEDLTPLLETMEAAFGCLENPSDWEHLWTFGPGMEWESEQQWETELRCVLDDEPGLNPGDCDGVNRSIEDFFPDTSANPYREIPLVLRSEDYRITEEDVTADGTLGAGDIGRVDLEAFRDDFACMSLVGTRGSGFERGLDAVNLAVSPQMTGGPNATEADRDQYPNAGFLRPDARTGIIYISDENDCSHDGELDQQSPCGVHECTIQENRLEQGLESHITPVEDLYNEFILNLMATRAGIDTSYADTLDELTNEDRNTAEHIRRTVLPTSVHGRIQHLDEIPARTPDPEIPLECPEDPRPWTNLYNWEVPKSCITAMGRGWSGHRYSQFLSHFDQHFPGLNSAGDVPGEICHPFGQTLQEIALFFQTEVASCLEEVYACSGFDDLCPPHATPLPDADDPNAPGHCTPYPGYNDTVASALGSVSADDLPSWSAGDLSSLQSNLGDSGIHYALDTLDIDDSMRQELFGQLQSQLASDGEDVRYYCDTGVEVRLAIPEDSDLTVDDLSTRADSQGEPYCIEGSYDNPRFPNSCVVHPDRYEWIGCDAVTDGLLLDWVDGNWDEDIGAFSLIYRCASRAAEASAAATDDDDDSADDEE